MPFQACCLAPSRAPRLRSDTGEAAREALAAAGFADRSDVVAGSFFDPLPPGAGRYLLSAIVHNWDDDAARAILRHCAEAADRDGAVYVVEKIGADGETVYTERDLRVFAHFGGRDGARDRRRRCLRGHQSPLCVAHVDTTDVTNVEGD